MNDVGARASGGAGRRASRAADAAAATTGFVASLAAAVLAAAGRLGLGAFAAGVAAAGALRARAAVRAAESSWMRFGLAVLGRIPDAAVMAAIAWHFRLAGRRTAAVAVAAVALTYLAAYARTRALALGWPIPVPGADPLRYACAVAALAIPGAAEAAGWALVVLTSIEFVRVATAAWRHAGSA